MSEPRLLTIMGSGETAPTMVKVHRALVERVGGPVAILDTPYGFQENADDITRRAQAYFADSVGTPAGVASFRSTDGDARSQAAAMAVATAARYVFAGPGSPTYALRQWAGSPLPAILAAKLREGGAVTFASAAALTLGLVTVPVYEIYKVGDEPRWAEGLDLLGTATGLRAAVVPHFDNAEGGHHDTRFCYLGERRLAVMERQLPDGAFVLGVDEHSGLVLDLGAGQASVVGLGGVTVRARGASVVLPAGTELPIDDLASAAAGASVRPSSAWSSPAPSASAAPAGSAPLLAEAQRLQAVFDAALAAGDVPAAVNAMLELDGVLVAWAADTTQSDEQDRARAVLRGMVVRLGELAAAGARPAREVLGPVVDVVLAARAEARAAQDWATSDNLRDRLRVAGVEVRDTASGQAWDLGTPPPEVAGGTGWPGC